MCKIVLAIAIATVTTGFLPASHADESTAWVIKPGVVGIDFDNKRGLDDDGIGGSLGLEYRYGNWGTELQGYEFDTELQTTGGDVDIFGGAINQYYYFKPRSRFNPYISMGVGHADFDVGAIDSKETQGSVGVGFESLLGRGLSLWADIRAVHGFDDSTTDGALGVGLAYRFGESSKKVVSEPIEPLIEPKADSDFDGVIDRLDSCPETRMGEKVDSNGCALDSDLDGITDANDKCAGTPSGVKVDRYGCKLKTTRVEEVQLDVHFELNSSALQNEYSAEIEKLAKFMKKYSDLNVVLEGHTDSTGEEDYNQMMSTKRADAVKQALIQNFGVTPDRISVRGFGEMNPVAGNETREGRAKNRRVIAALTKTVEE